MFFSFKMYNSHCKLCTQNEKTHFSLHCCGTNLWVFFCFGLLIFRFSELGLLIFFEFHEKWERSVFTYFSHGDLCTFQETQGFRSQLSVQCPYLSYKYFFVYPDVGVAIVFTKAPKNSFHLLHCSFPQTGEMECCSYKQIPSQLQA